MTEAHDERWLTELPYREWEEEASTLARKVALKRLGRDRDYDADDAVQEARLAILKRNRGDFGNRVSEIRPTTKVWTRGDSGRRQAVADMGRELSEDAWTDVDPRVQLARVGVYKRGKDRESWLVLRRTMESAHADLCYYISPIDELSPLGQANLSDVEVWLREHLDKSLDASVPYGDDRRENFRQYFIIAMLNAVRAIQRRRFVSADVEVDDVMMKRETEKERQDREIMKELGPQFLEELRQEFRDAMDALSPEAREYLRAHELNSVKQVPAISDYLQTAARQGGLSPMPTAGQLALFQELWAAGKWTSDDPRARYVACRVAAAITRPLNEVIERFCCRPELSKEQRRLACKEYRRILLDEYFAASN